MSIEVERGITQNIQGIFSFGGMKLTHADIEWLLVTLEGGRGPVDWNDETHRTREGLNLRGARIQKEADLTVLPLAKLLGALLLISVMTWRLWM